jgi:8-oxo-dGTP diphosphatase
MDKFRVAAKAFIVKDGKLFMMKRRANDPHKPGKWDIPGGRLELGESPYDGLPREVKEETGNRVEIGMPLDVRHFVRDDGQQITLIIFLCKFQDEEIVISEEHQEYTWFDIDSDKDKIPEFFQIALANYKKLKHD